jgi:hypothetical protein
MVDTHFSNTGSAPQSTATAGRPTLFRPARAAVAAVVILLCLLILAGTPRGILSRVLADWSGEAEQIAKLRLAREELRIVEAMNVTDQTQIVEAGRGARMRNSQIPFSALPIEKSAVFTLAELDKAAFAAALQCLTQAVYYEAGFEPLKGRRAVAQVVLNRVRHPAYPNSVCGVVYQGSARATGCQFSFTCDGSLLRPPAPAAWRQAEAVARQALSGIVETSIGTATHYHADYVLPRWAFRLEKISQLGQHIFYRFKGVLGRSGTLSSRYNGLERIPEINLAALRERLLAKSAGRVEEHTGQGLSVPPHIMDRHADNDIGGRLDTSKQWRLSIPDPVEASSRYRAAIASETDESKRGLPTNLAVAANQSPFAGSQ